MILLGEKTVELRRRAPRRSTDFWIALYATAPERAIVGVVRAREVLVGSPDQLWAVVEDGCGLGRDEYQSYFEGAGRAVGIRLTDPVPFEAPILLEDLRRLWPSFRTPQSFAYLSDEQVQDVWDRSGLCFIRRAEYQNCLFPQAVVSSKH